jgi:hypothetical protein
MPDLAKFTLTASNNGSPVGIAVDQDVFELYGSNGVSIGSHGYPQISGVQKYRSILLHRLLAQPEKGQYVDHINGNKFDCRRSNLRICTNGQNGMNRGPSRISTTGFKGVYKAGRKFLARIEFEGQAIRLGLFTDPEDAARAYDAAALKYFGEFAFCNLPQGIR